MQTNKIKTFVNRDKELNYLKNWISQEPNYLLFCYGPKNCGKTSLLMNFVENQLNNKSYVIKHIDLKQNPIASYSDFIQVFFTPDNLDASEKVKKKRLYNIFRLPIEIIEGMEDKSLDPFVVMKKELQKKVKKGKQPVIIIDEVQAIEPPYRNGLKEFFKELFNFFVAMTKESHLCHVVIAGSDGYFLNSIYDDSRLSKSCGYFEMTHLSKNNVYAWLRDLEQESKINSFTLTDDQIETIWQHLGGNIFEISSVLAQLKPAGKKKSISNAKLMKMIEKQTSESIDLLRDYAGFRENKRDLLREIYAINEKMKETPGRKGFSMSDLIHLVKNKQYDIITLDSELNKLVRNNILAFSPVSADYCLQGYSMDIALKRYLDSLVF
jgi:hypothetical protein